MSIQTKFCHKCSLELTIDLFYKNRSRSDGLQTCCKSCMKVTNTLSYQRHRKERNKYSAEYQKGEKSKEYRRNWARHKYHTDEEHRKKCIAAVVERERNLLTIDALYKIKHNLRSRLRGVLKMNTSSKSKMLKHVLCCSIPFFKRYIEVQFSKGMNWENYGKLWDIDHIVPISYENSKNEKELIVRFHWSNCQPMWHSDNNSKSNRYISFGDNTPLTNDDYIKYNFPRLLLIFGRIGMCALVHSVPVYPPSHILAISPGRV